MKRHLLLIPLLFPLFANGQPIAGCDSISLPDTISVPGECVFTLPLVLIGGGASISVVWTPRIGLSDTSILNPIFSGDTSAGWYYVAVNSVNATNLVANGDFSGGNTGFSSAYTYYPSGPGALSPPGAYTITTDPDLNNPYTNSPFGDHTNGTGNMMGMNGASTPIDVWCETIAISPNTLYDFSAWFANWSSDTSDNLPIIQFEINGTLIGTTFNFPHPDGVWTQFFTTWYSGSNTSAAICINDQQTAYNGNDFAIDDISFRQVCTAKDSVYIVVRPDTLFIVPIVKNDICEAKTGSINVEAKGGTAPYSYLWSNKVTGNEITGLLAGTYSVTVTDVNTCIQTFSLPVGEDICPPIIIHNVITPDGDGINDTWVIEGIENYPTNSVQLFDKWGDLIYEKNNYSNSWEGTAKSKKLPDGTYYYIIKLNRHNEAGGQNIWTGSLLIKR